MEDSNRGKRMGANSTIPSIKEIGAKMARSGWGPASGGPDGISGP